CYNKADGCLSIFWTARSSSPLARFHLIAVQGLGGQWSRGNDGLSVDVLVQRRLRIARTLADTEVLRPASVPSPVVEPLRWHIQVLGSLFGREHCLICYLGLVCFLH